MSIVSVSTSLMLERSLSFDSWRLEGGGDPGEIRGIVFGMSFGSHEIKSQVPSWTLATHCVHVCQFRSSSPLVFAVVRPTRFDLPQATVRTPSVPRVQLGGRLRYHTCVSHCVATPCKCKCVCRLYLNLRSFGVCFFLKMGMDLRTINAIKNCFTVCSRLDTLACSSCESRMV